MAGVVSSSLTLRKGMPTFGTMSALIGPNDSLAPRRMFPIASASGRSEADRFGIDVTYDGATGYELASRHEASLEAPAIPHSSRQELGGARTASLTIPAGHVATVVTRSWVTAEVTAAS